MGFSLNKNEDFCKWYKCISCKAFIETTSSQASRVFKMFLFLTYNMQKSGKKSVSHQILSYTWKWAENWANSCNLVQIQTGIMRLCVFLLIKREYKTSSHHKCWEHAIFFCNQHPKIVGNKYWILFSKCETLTDLPWGSGPKCFDSHCWEQKYTMWWNREQPGERQAKRFFTSPHQKHSSRWSWASTCCVWPGRDICSGRGWWSCCSSRSPRTWSSADPPNPSWTSSAKHTRTRERAAAAERSWRRLCWSAFAHLGSELIVRQFALGQHKHSLLIVERRRPFLLLRTFDQRFFKNGCQTHLWGIWAPRTAMDLRKRRTESRIRSSADVRPSQEVQWRILDHFS